MDSTTVVYTITPWDQPQLGHVAYAAPAAAEPMKAKDGKPTCTVIAMGVPAAAEGGDALDESDCQCNAGWWLFGLGFLLKPLWLVGALLPVCDPSVRTVPHKRKAWLANVITLSVIAAVVAVALVGAVVLFVLLALQIGQETTVSYGHMEPLHHSTVVGSSWGGGMGSSSVSVACSGVGC